MCEHTNVNGGTPIANAAEETQLTTASTVATTELPSTFQMVIQNAAPILLIIAIFYFLVLRPQQKKVKEHQQMLGNLKIGENVVTSGGIIGSIVRQDQNIFVIEISPGVEIKVRRDMVVDKYIPVDKAQDKTQNNGQDKKKGQYNGGGNYKKRFNRKKKPADTNTPAATGTAAASTSETKAS